MQAKECKEGLLLKTRTRMVSFRLSQDEYDRLRELSLAGSARSVSEFARVALCRMPATSDEEHSSTRLANMEKVVEQLAIDLGELRRLVETLRGANSAEDERFAEVRRQ